MIFLIIDIKKTDVINQWLSESGISAAKLKTKIFSGRKHET
jgi:hypothetical protein